MHAVESTPEWRAVIARSRSRYGTIISYRPGSRGMLSPHSLPYKWMPVEITPPLAGDYARIRWNADHVRLIKSKANASEQILQGWIDLRGVEIQPTPDTVRDLLIDCAPLLSRLRRARGAEAPIRLDERLVTAALDQALWVANTDQYRMHHRPDDSTPLHRAIAAGYAPTVIKELAFGVPGPSEDSNRAWHNWRAAPDERALLTDRQFTDVGIAAAMGIWGTAWVMLLARDSA